MIASPHELRQDVRAKAIDDPGSVPVRVYVDASLEVREGVPLDVRGHGKPSGFTGAAGVGWTIVAKERATELAFGYKKLPHTYTAEMGELQAIVHGISAAKVLGFKDIILYSDSLTALRILSHDDADDWVLYAGIVKHIREAQENCSVRILYRKKEQNARQHRLAKRGMLEAEQNPGFHHEKIRALGAAEHKPKTVIGQAIHHAAHLNRQSKTLEGQLSSRLKAADADDLQELLELVDLYDKLLDDRVGKIRDAIQSLIDSSQETRDFTESPELAYSQVV